ncbi:MAG: RNA polymerase sigma factor [Bacteroidia bacterium]
MQIPATIIKDCIAQDRKAQAWLYKRCYPIMMSICLRYGNDSDDAGGLVNASFLKILTKLKTRDTNAPFEAWIRRITINTSIDHYRKHQRKYAHVEYTDMQEGTGKDLAVDYNKADQHFDAEAVLILVQQLPPMTQQVFNLYAIDGYSHKEIADMLEIAVGTSKWHVSSARKTIQLALLQDAVHNETISL